MAHSVSDNVSDNNMEKKITEEADTKLPGQFVVWYHSVTNNSWAKDSYDNLCEGLPGGCVETIGDIAKVYASFQNNVTAGMFFLMRKGILPMWEDPANAKGGFWSFKVSKRSSNETWLKLTAAFVGNTLLRDPSKANELTGISASPKISNCVMKIWNRNRSFNAKNVFTDTIPSLEETSLLYKANKG
jgi:hypothetical protein